MKPVLHVSSYIMDDLQMHPVDAVLAFLNMPTFVEDAGYTVALRSSLNWPTEFLPPTKELSAPLLLFVLLVNRHDIECNTSFALAHVETIRRRLPDINVLEKALFTAAGWLCDCLVNPPICDAALLTLRPDLQSVVGLLSRTSKTIFGSLGAASEAISFACKGVWELHQTTPFFKTWRTCLQNALVLVTPVQKNDNVDFSIDNFVGLICCPVDKVILLATILFSNHDFADVWYKHSPETRPKLGVPSLIKPFLNAYCTTREQHETRDATVYHPDH